MAKDRAASAYGHWFGIVGCSGWTAITLVILLLFAGFCCVPLGWLFNLPWSCMGQGQQRDYMAGLVDHYQPIVEAVREYEEDHNRPPSSLGRLVPEYIEELPELEPGLVTYFNYSVTRQRRDGGSEVGRRYLWYDLYERHTRCRIFPIEDFERPSTQEHLIIVLDDAARIVCAFTDPEREHPTGRNFDSKYWQTDPSARAAMVGSVLSEFIPSGVSFTEVKEVLGSPDGEGRYYCRWTMFVDVGRTSLDSPFLGFASDGGEDATGMWHYRDWQFAPGEHRGR